MFCPGDKSGGCSFHWKQMEEIEERVKALLKNTLEVDINEHGSFAERAEWYYHKLPQLLALLQDLHRGYISLQKRYNRLQESNKNHVKQHGSFLLSSVDHDSGQQQQQHDEISVVDYSDVESSSSYHQTPPSKATNKYDDMVAELVIKNVEANALVERMREMETKQDEQLRKIELLEKLVKVLESERVVLLEENTRLVYKVGEISELNARISSEAMLFKGRASELGACLLKMKEDHKTCKVTRKISKSKPIQDQERSNKRTSKFWSKMKKINFMCGFQLCRSI